MQIQINTDSHITSDEPFRTYVTDHLRDRLARFALHLTRIEVHLADENAGRAGPDDKRCTLEARMEHRPPLAVHCHAESVHQALTGACDTLLRALDRTVSKLQTQHQH